MTDPYTLNFFQPIVITYSDIECLHRSCRYPLAFAQRVRHYQTPGFSLLRQQYSYTPFHIDLVEVNTDTAFEFGFEIHEKQLFLFFMLDGDMLFTTDTRKPIARTRANHFLMSYYDKGKYLVQVGRGTHIPLVVTISPSWVSEISDDFAQIRRLLHEFDKNFKPYQAYHQGKLDKRVYQLLRKVYQYQKSPKGIMDGHIRKYITFILQHYNTVLAGKHRKLAYRILNYLDTHFRDERLSNEFLTGHFSVTERTMINHFKEEFNITPHQYYTQLRMEHAHWLINDNALGIDQVHMEVGYKNENAFRMAYRKYLDSL